MKILAIETSCDDTSIAIFEDNKLLALDTKSQIKIHEATGGVVPEVAAREHANAIFEVLEKVLKITNSKIEEIDYIGVTAFPGLLPSLLTGLTTARTIGKVLGKKVIELNHIEGHIFSNFLDRELSEIKFPLVCLTVSGGHNDIYYMENMWDYQKIGTSNDDAAGECYDKVAKMMGMGYPGGPIISKKATLFGELRTQELKVSNETKVDNKKTQLSALSSQLFPRVWLKKDEYDFSFSGLKSAVKREIDKRIEEKGVLSEEDKMEISYEFQNSANEVLAYKLVNAGIKKNVKTVMLAGGVSANDNLLERIKSLSEENGLNFIHPVKKLYCMDNAAMIGILTYYKIVDKKF